MTVPADVRSGGLSLAEHADTAHEGAPGDTLVVVAEQDAARLDGCHRLATLGTLVAGIAHEVNNPITYVAGNLAELDRVLIALRDVVFAYRHARHDLDPDARARIDAAETKLEAAGGEALLDELIADALEGAVRVRDLARNLLALGRSPAHAPVQQRIDVHEVLDFTLRLTRPEMRVHVDAIQEFRATRSVAGDRARLGQVFLNLLRNAVQACSPRLDGSAATGARHRIVVRTLDTDRGVRVEIEDDGPGVAPEIRDRLFAPFVTSKPPEEGTGLGLHLSRRVVEELGGTLHYRPMPERGALFVIELPSGAPPSHGPAD